MAGPRILVEGVGGIGGVVAGQMLRAGQDLTLVTGNADIARAIAERGLRVKTRDGAYSVPARAVATVEALAQEPPFDLALLIMKATRVVEAARVTVPLLASEGYLVTCQNGIVEDAVASIVGAERVVSAIVGWGGTMHGPGDVERTGPGAIHLGELDGRRSERVLALQRLLEP
ncbi:MAG: 2-dehydropantoate 2-reductase, partial [Pseudomonadota bacterium]